MPCQKAILNSFQYLITKFNTNDNIETNASGLSIELRRLANILVNLKKSQESQRNLLLIDFLIKSTVFEENLALSVGFIEFITLNSQTLGILSTKEIELLNILKFQKNINFLKILDNHHLVKLNDEKNKINSNLINLLEKFNAPNEFLKFFKNRIERKKNDKTNDEPNEENKYLNRLKECLKYCMLLEVSPLETEEKAKSKAELLKKYFK